MLPQHGRRRYDCRQHNEQNVRRGGHASPISAQPTPQGRAKHQIDDTSLLHVQHFYESPLRVNVRRRIRLGVRWSSAAMMSFFHPNAWPFEPAVPEWVLSRSCSPSALGTSAGLGCPQVVAAARAPAFEVEACLPPQVADDDEADQEEQETSAYRPLPHEDRSRRRSSLSKPTSRNRIPDVETGTLSPLPTLRSADTPMA